MALRGMSASVAWSQSGGSWPSFSLLCSCCMKVVSVIGSSVISCGVLFERAALSSAICRRRVILPVVVAGALERTTTCICFGVRCWRAFAGCLIWWGWASASIACLERSLLVVLCLRRGGRIGFSDNVTSIGDTSSSSKDGSISKSRGANLFPWC